MICMDAVHIVGDALRESGSGSDCTLSLGCIWIIWTDRFSTQVSQTHMYYTSKCVHSGVQSDCTPACSKMIFLLSLSAFMCSRGKATTHERICGAFSFFLSGSPRRRRSSCCRVILFGEKISHSVALPSSDNEMNFATVICG